MAHSLIPVHNNGGLIYNVSFFNDQDAFYYEFDINCTLYDQYRSYNFGKDYCQDPSVNSSVSLLEKSWNITKGLLKRDGNVKDIIESYKSKKVGNLKNEFESTIDETLKKYISDDKFIGAISTFMDVYHRSVERNPETVDANLLRFHSFFYDLWNTFWKVNNHNTKGGDAKVLCGRTLSNGEDVTVFTRAIGYMYIVAVPITHYVFSEVYKEAIDYLNSQEDIFKDTCIKEAEQEWISKLLEEGDDLKSHIAYFLDMYETYNRLYTQPPNDDKRKSAGWGAYKDGTDVDKIDEETSNLLASGSILGISSLASANLANIFALFSFEEIAYVPLPQLSSSISDIKTDEIQDHTYSTPDPSSSITSASECPTPGFQSGEGYPNLNNDGEWVEDVDKNDDYNLKRDIPTFDKRKFSEMCGNSENWYYQECIEVLGRHMIAVDKDSKKIKTRKDFSNVDDNGDNLVEQDGSLNFARDTKKRDSDKEPIFAPVDIYIVNQNGRSPGVACNALKYLANNFNSPRLEGRIDNIDEYKNSGKGMLVLQRGNVHLRYNVLGEYSCSKADDGDLAREYDTLKLGWQRDEFPPSSANIGIESPDDISVTCVPLYENQIDGCQLRRFYAGTEPKSLNEKCIKSILTELGEHFYVRKVNANKVSAADVENGNSKYRCFPGMRLNGGCTTTDYLKLTPNRNKGRVAAKVNKKSYFGVLVNIYDHNNNIIDCSLYDEGSMYFQSLD